MPTYPANDNLNLGLLPRKELQALAKQHGCCKANAKSELIIAALTDFFASQTLQMNEREGDETEAETASAAASEIASFRSEAMSTLLTKDHGGMKMEPNTVSALDMLLGGAVERIIKSATEAKPDKPLTLEDIHAAVASSLPAEFVTFVKQDVEKLLQSPLVFIAFRNLPCSMNEAAEQYMAAVEQYLCSEVLSLSQCINTSPSLSTKTMLRAIFDDKDLVSCFTRDALDAVRSSLAAVTGQFTRGGDGVEINSTGEEVGFEGCGTVLLERSGPGSTVRFRVINAGEHIFIGVCNLGVYDVDFPPGERGSYATKSDGKLCSSGKMVDGEHDGFGYAGEVLEIVFATDGKSFEWSVDGIAGPPMEGIPTDGTYVVFVGAWGNAALEVIE
jgi:hypothetical protein